MDKIRTDTPKKQHYVPQFLLKNFSFGKKHKIFTFDKSRFNSFEASVKNSASENGFYNLKIENENHTLEHKLSKLESICSVLIRRICKEKSLKGLGRDDFIVLSVFVSNLLLRVKKQRIFFEQFNTVFAQKLRDLGLDPNNVENFKVLETEEIDKMHTEFTDEHVFEISKQINPKPVVLLKAPSDSKFIISDNPVAMYNYWPTESRGDKGVSVPGVEIQVPISTKLCLSFLCPIFLNDIEEKLCFVSKNRHIPEILDIDISYGQKILEAVKYGEIVELNSENVIFSNSMQIADSLNYIYSINNDFRLAEDMIRKNPNLSNGKVFRMWP